MNIIGNFILFVVNTLVRVGDLVIFVITAPINILDVLQRKRSLKGEFKLKKRRKLTLAKFGPASLGAGVLIWGAAKSVWTTYSRRYQSQALERDENRKRKKREKEKRMVYHRPSIFYKLKYVLVGFFLSALFIFIPLASLIFVSDLPNLSDLSVKYIPKTTKIYDRNNALLYEIYANQNRTIVNLSDVPKVLRDATIAIEDKDFYQHPGFDFRGMARALLTNVQNRGFQGGSTITQQLIKSAFLTPDPTIVRKVKEVALAFWAERKYSKNEILELYLNYVPYGGTAWGIQSAADIYFGKGVQDLDLAESAFLAGLPQSPSIYSPLFSTNGNRWKARQKEVLDQMVRLSYITGKEADEAYRKELIFKETQIPLRAPHFVMYVRDQLIRRYGISEVERGGLIVKTTLDLKTQQEAERIVEEQVEEDASLNVGNGAALISDPTNGDIIAMVGSRDYFDLDHDGNVNLTTSLRQPGSSIKLVTYTLALSDGYTEATILDDSPLTIKTLDGKNYTPVNYDGTFHGRVPLRTAFANSYNIPPVRITQKFGADRVKDFGEKMGIASWNGVDNYGVSITLGGVDVRMTDMANAYGTIANNGKLVTLDPFLEIINSRDESVYKKEPDEREVVDEGVAFIISDILADNRARSGAFGLNSVLNIPGARVSVKTGTTDNKRDNWTIGFTPNVVVATWVGNNDNAPLSPNLASGITGAAPMWNRIMSMMIDKTGTPSAVNVPENVVKKFCAGQSRYFVRGTENSANCSAPPQSSPSPTIQ